MPRRKAGIAQKDTANLAQSFDTDSFDTTLLALFTAQSSGSKVDATDSLRLTALVESLKSLDLRQTLHMWCADNARTSFIRALRPFNTFPTKKVRFNVFAISETKLERVEKAHGEKTTKAALDIVLESLITRVPPDYWEHKAEVAALLSAHLPPANDASPRSLTINSLGYALLQELAEMLGQSPGAILEASIDLVITELNIRKAKTEQAAQELEKLWAQAAAVEGRLLEIEDKGEAPISSRFRDVMHILGNLRDAIQSNLNEDIPIDPDDMTQTGA